MKWLWLILMLLGTCKAEAQLMGPKHWSNELIAQLDLTSNDPLRTENLKFSANGHLSAKIGNKSSAVKSFDFSWRLDGDSLQIFDTAGKLFDEFTFGEMEDYTVTVRRPNGQWARFTRKDQYQKLDSQGKILQGIILQVDFDRTDIDVVLTDLEKISKKLDPTHNGMKFVARIPASKANQISRYHREISIELDQASVQELLRYICDQTNLESTLAGDTVVFAPSIPESEKPNPPTGQATF